MTSNSSTALADSSFEPAQLAARLGHIGWRISMLAGLPPNAEHTQALCRVVEVHRNAVRLHDGQHAHTAQVHAKVGALAVGDWVLCEHDPQGAWWVVQASPPHSSIKRIDGSGVSHAVVNNIDTLLVVMGLDSDFNLNRAERYLLLAHAAGVGAVMVLTKADLCRDIDARQDALRRRLGTALDVVVANGLSAHDCKPLLAYLRAGQTAALMGSSGAGKSTLTNTLMGIHVQHTGEVNASGNKGQNSQGHGMQGRHTTTSRSLHVLPSGGCIIDTPGLRTLRVDGDASTVQSGFDDIAKLAQSCKFGNCQHNGEPGCAVRPVLDPARLKNYNKLLRDAERDHLSALDRQVQLSQFKQRSKSARLGQQLRGKL